MSRRTQLNQYIQSVQQRLRLAAGLRGAAIVTGTALLATIAIALLLNHYAFPAASLTPARAALFAICILAIAAAAWPLFRLTRNRAIHRAEARFPELDQRLLTFVEREQANDPFIDLLAADTLKLTAEAPATRLIPQSFLAVFLALAILSTGILWWLVIARPGPVGYGASLLWTGPKKNAPLLYEIRVTPGDQAVRRNSDQMVTAQVIGLDNAKVNLFARFQNTDKWEPVPMQPIEGAAGFQYLFAGLPASVEYYVAAGPVESKHFNFRVVDLPAVKQIEVTYRYPKWTGMENVSEEHGGDLRALEGTEADLTVVMDSPLKDGVLSLDGAQPLHLTPIEGNRYKGAVHMAKDGAYHVAAIDHGQPVRLSEDYFISTSKATPPEIAIDRPGADYKASPIEEVTIGLRANAEFGLRNMALHYSVNGGKEQAVPLLDHAGTKTSKATHTLRLEDFKLAPGDVVSLYATAGDAHAESKTDISFIQADPFEREFSQSQAGGGGGGGGGQQQGNQTDISRREKELIAATWKQQNGKNATLQQNADMGKTLSEAQDKLREQALALSSRMQSRDLASANEEFTGFEKDMQIAAAAMVPSSDKLKAKSWPEALPNEQKALQALLRAEATFRKIQVAFGQKGGGGGGGGGGAGRDLASLFDLEMDTEKNQYETAQTGSAAEEQAKKVDDALAKLDALAKRQEEIAQQQQNKQQTFQQRWQQEMLRREAEELQRQMEQMQQGQQSASNSGQSGKSSSSSGSQGQASQQQAGKDGNTDPRVAQALNRLRTANEEMRRAGTQGQGGQDQARQAAEQLKEATSLLGGAQKQQATGKLDALSREADRLAKEESAQANRIQSLKNQQSTPGSGTAEQYAQRMQQRNKLAEDRQRLSDDLGHLQKGLRDTAREMAPSQPGTSSKLRDALGQMDQSDLDNRVQRTADWLRRGIDPNSNGTEAEIAKNLRDLNNQLRAAQQGAGQEAPGKPGESKPGQGQGNQIAALDHVGRLRSEIERLGRGQNPGNQPGQRGQQGQNAQQSQGQQGQGSPQPGQAQGRSGQQGSGQQQGQGQQPGQANGQNRNGQQQAGTNTGDLGNRTRQGGGSGGPADRNLNTGNNTFSYTGPRVQRADPTTNPADSERVIRQGLAELNQLRTLAKNDPAALKEIADLAREMQQLDPSRFPGNPAMVEALHTQVLTDVDKLELQLARNTDAPKGQVRTGKPPAIPPGYQNAVAEYYRRLGKGQ